MDMSESSPDMLGSFERNVLGKFVYKTSGSYTVYRAQGMNLLMTLPRTFNIWQNAGQLEIWFLAKGA